MSDVALGKICRKHDVPKPPLGWWAKQSAGQKVARTPLPRAKAATSDRIVIAGGETRTEPDALAAAHEAARVLASAAPEREMAADPIVTRTAAKLRAAKPSATNGLVATDGKALIKASVAPGSVDRFELAMTRLAEALTTVGGRFATGEDSAVIVCDGESIGFSIAEALRREKHVLTAEEGAHDEARRERRSKLRDPWRDELDNAISFLRRPDWDYRPTGRLSLELQSAYLPGSPRRTFGDAKFQRLEALAPDIAVGVAVVAAAMKLNRAQREEEARRHEEARRVREEALRNRHVEERRAAALDAVLNETAALDRLGRLIEDLRGQLGACTGRRVATFLETAERRLADREAAASADGLERRFADQRLFGEDDDHGFRPPYAY